MSNKGKGRQQTRNNPNGSMARLYTDRLKGGHFRNSDRVALHGSQFEVIDRVIQNCRYAPLTIRCDLMYRPQSYDGLYAGPWESPSKPINLRREIHWACSVCDLLSDRLNAVLNLRNEFYKQILNGGVAESLCTLAKLRSDFGVSLWLLRTEPFLSQLTDGLSGNKKWLKSIEDGDSNVRVKFLALYFSFLAEETTSAMAFERAMDEFFSKTDNANPLIDYLRQELIPVTPSSVNKLAYYLFCQNANSLLDLYDVLIRVLGMLGSSGQIEEVSSQTIPIICRLENSITDVRWKSIRNLIDPSCQVSHRDIVDCFIPILNAYTEGDFRVVRELTENCIGKGISDLDLWELYLRAYSVTSEGKTQQLFDNLSVKNSTLTFQILADIYELILKKPSALRSLQRLRKIAYQLTGSSLSEGLYALCIQQTPLGSGEEDYYWRRVRLLSQHGCTPQFSLVYTKPKDRETFLASWELHHGRQKCLLPFLYYRATNEGVVDFKCRRNDLYLADMCCAQKDHETAIMLLERLINSASLYCFEKERVTKCLLTCYRLTEQHYNEMRLLADTIVTNPYFLLSIDHREVYSRLSKCQFDTLELSVNYAIFAHWYQELLPVSEQDTYELYVAYERVLEGAKYSSITDLISSNADRDIEAYKRNYILKHVCSSSILEYDWRVNSQKEKEDARIAICDYLSRSDVACAEEYQREALQLVRNAEIRKLVKTVDESRIFVDTQRIVDRLRNGMDESFRRFVDLRVLSADLRRENRMAVDDLVREESERSSNPFASDGAFLVFNNIFQSFANDFLFHDEYGLDHFLSGRIRHGVVDSELRSVFEISNLVTKKSNEAYLSNKYWAHKFENIGYERQEQLQLSLRDLSGKVDSAIARVKGSWVQIAFRPAVVTVSAVEDVSAVDALLQTLFKEDGHGFDFSFKLSEMWDFFYKCPECGMIDEIAEYVFQIMWGRTERCLAELRTRIQSELKDILLGFLNDFELEIGRLDLGTNVHLESALAQCRSEIHRKSTSIAQWFRLSDKYRLDDYTLETMIKTCITILRNRNADFFRSITVECEDSRLYPGDTFLSFVDAILLLLGNILKHAREQMDSTVIRVRNLAPDTVDLSVRNDLPSDVDAEELITNIKRAHDRTGLRNEGGTGFVKLQKILRDLSRLNPQFNYKVSDGALVFHLVFKLTENKK